MHEDKTQVKTHRVVSGGKSSKNGNPKGESVWDYSKSPESKDHVVLKDKYDLFIGGKRVKTKKYFDSVNPANEEIISRVSYASKSDVDKAVIAAERAYSKVWSKTPP